MSKDEKGADGDYEVGYGKTPKHTRYKKGQSGNPEGRPKKSKTLSTEVAEILNGPMTVQKAGVPQKMGAFEVGVRRLVQKGQNEKDLNAIIAFLKLCESHGVMTPPPVDDGGGVIFAPKGMTPKEWIDSMADKQPPTTGDQDDAKCRKLS